MPQMFPMSMLILSVVVMGMLMVCLVRLYWAAIDTPASGLALEVEDTLARFVHLW